MSATRASRISEGVTWSRRGYAVRAPTTSPSPVLWPSRLYSVLIRHSFASAHTFLPSLSLHAAVEFAMVADVPLGREEQSDGTHVFPVSLISSCPSLSSHRHSLSE